MGDIFRNTFSTKENRYLNLHILWYVSRWAVKSIMFIWNFTSYRPRLFNYEQKLVDKGTSINDITIFCRLLTSLHRFWTVYFFKWSRTAGVADGFHIGDRVVVSGSKPEVVAFLGKTQFAALWAEAVNTENYQKNRSPTKALPNMTSEEAYSQMVIIWMAKHVG